MKNIAIFGTGKYGERVYRFLSETVGKERILFFIKTDAGNESFHDLKVISLNDIIANDMNDIIIVIEIGRAHV